MLRQLLPRQHQATKAKTAFTQVLASGYLASLYPMTETLEWCVTQSQTVYWLVFWFVHSEQATALSNPSQMELYEPRASQTRRYPPSVSSSPQKDMQPKVRQSCLSVYHLHFYENYALSKQTFFFCSQNGFSSIQTSQSLEGMTSFNKWFQCKGPLISRTITIMLTVTVKGNTLFYSVHVTCS